MKKPYAVLMLSETDDGSVKIHAKFSPSLNAKEDAIDTPMAHLLALIAMKSIHDASNQEAEFEA